MKFLYLIIFILFFSCKQSVNQANILNQNDEILDSIIMKKNYIIDKKYEPLSLSYKGKPLKIIGETTDSLKTTNFSFREDPNLEYQDYFGVILDYLSMDDNLQIHFDEYKSVNGIVYFSSINKNKQIFTFSGYWTIHSDVNNSTKEIIRDSITKKLFPKLEGKLKIENGWNYKLESKDYIENFEIVAPKVNKSFFWNLRYKVILK